MTLLRIMSDTDRSSVSLSTTDVAVIAAELAPFGVRLDRWPTTDLADTDGPAEVLAAYAADVDALRGEFPIVDVIRMVPRDDDPEWTRQAVAARCRFLDEHTHDEDEVRFFVDGVGCFYLHLDDKVYAVVCERGDLVSVPAGTAHWFDMGERPDFCAIRFFQEEDGWVAGFTGSTVASRMPTLDELRAPAGSPR
ncbi:cupin [Actinokineospora auranticolor]|uniref:Acireductone dioxygenase n=1 Tax=Actinokineospora auranticolor TaxID=155976 RepID=A0A2S6GD49_9PSEU|nr:cupin [Actinokineospora auranticolor]PPK63153.1 1,2-dihydroxy-3-keto-5-methylthiopentene dioxygenase [Actinokineospora auranticolor]